MRIKISLLFFLLFSVAFTAINAQDKSIYLDFDKVTGEQTFYLDTFKKEPFKEITPLILKKYDNVEVTVYNLDPSVNQLIFSLIKDSIKDDELDMSSLTGMITGGITGGNFYNAYEGASTFNISRGESSSPDVFKNPKIISSKNNSEVLSLLSDKKEEYENIKKLCIIVKILEKQGYPFQTLKDVFYQYIEEFDLNDFISKRMDDDYINSKFNTLSSNYFISTALVNRYYQTKEDTAIISSRGSTAVWEVNGINYRNTKIEEGLLPFFKNNSNLESVLDDYEYIVNFQNNLKEKNYTRKVVVPLNESYGEVNIRSYSDVGIHNPSVFTFFINPKPKFKITSSFGISFSKYMNNKLEIEELGGTYDTINGWNELYSFKDVAQEDYYPSFGSFMNFSHVKPNRIYNLGFATGIVVPLKQNSSPSLVVGPTIAIGQKNKIHVNLLYGLSPRESYNRDDIELGRVYEGDMNKDFEETVRYEPTISIGISWGIGGGRGGYH